MERPWSLDFSYNLSVLASVPERATHLLMRFFTVKDKGAARVSAGVALGAVSYVNLLIFFVIGIGSVALVKGNGSYLDASGVVIGGSNMVSVHLADAVGGEVFMGVIAAIAFATILAVVAGLMLASVTALTHDLYSNIVKTDELNQHRQIRLSKIAAMALGTIVAQVSHLSDRILRTSLANISNRCLCCFPL